MMQKPWKATGKQSECFFHHISEQRATDNMLDLDSWALSQDDITKHILSWLLKLKSSLPEKPSKEQPEKGYKF